MRAKHLPRLVVGIALLSLCGCGSNSTTSPSSGAPAAATGQTAAPAAAPAPAPAPITVPVGTTIAVTLDQALTSKTAKLGDNFTAVMAEPVMVDGKQAIPKGAKVSGTVTLVRSAGRFSGRGDLGLSLSSVVVNGKTYDLHTRVDQEMTSARGKRTAIGAGAGAAAGAVIGAIAGGGKGAAIGGAAGAGAGTAGAALTGEREVYVPAETTLHFVITAPLSIEAQ